MFGFKLLDVRNTMIGLKHADFLFFNCKRGRFLDELFSYLSQHPQLQENALLLYIVLD